MTKGPAPIAWETRFFSKVSLPDENGCMNWTAGTAGGYGKFGMKAGDVRHAHRVAYEYWVGPIPEGSVIDHLCSNKRCLNPEHLDPTSIGNNVQRYWAKQDHCKQGHQYTPETTMSHHGRRECRVCANQNQRNRKKRTAA